MEITNKNTGKFKILNGTQIKLLAAIFMFFDHVHEMFYWHGAPMWLTMLGRPVFPLFLFMSAEAFHYTRDRHRYLRRLLTGTWIMAILTTVLQRMFPMDDVILINNAFSTFFVSALWMGACDLFRSGLKECRKRNIIKAIGIALLPVIFCIPVLMAGTLAASPTYNQTIVDILLFLSMVLPNVMMAEGGIGMCLIGLVFYIFRKHRWVQFSFLLAISLLLLIRSPQNIQWMMIFAAIPMLLYNGQKGKGLKNFFYIYYPAHIAFLYLLAYIVH